MKLSPWHPRMNLGTLAMAALLLASLPAAAQGTISINMATGTKPRVLLDGVNVVGADNVWMEVLVAGATGLSGGAAEPFHIAFLGSIGLISKGTLTVQGIPGGATAAVTIRAWDKDSGADYDRATVRASTTFSVVLGGALDANGIPGHPASIVPAFTGLELSSKPVFSFERRGSDRLRLSCAAASGYTPQTSDGIGGPWRPLENAPVIDGGLLVVEIPAGSGNRFYRWIRQ